ncbi:MAG: ferrous iron transport protein A [Candidatus Cloacimonetes bacterium]|nr:ferrous iron transport protein A [Candidatus Cloacimonadota bacterium]
MRPFRLRRRLGLWWGRVRRGQRRQRQDRQCHDLSQAREGSVVIVTCNHDIRMVERGLYCGISVRILRNQSDEPNLIIAVGDSRYALDRRIAARIKVRYL